MPDATEPAPDGESEEIPDITPLEDSDPNAPPPPRTGTGRRPLAKRPSASKAKALSLGGGAGRVTPTPVAPGKKPPPPPPPPATLLLAVVLAAFYGLEYLVGTNGATYLRLGASEHGAIWEGGEYWRLLTCSFLHGGPFHLLMNASALLSLGGILERLYGAARFLVVYFVSVIVASLISAWAAGRLSTFSFLFERGMTPSVGASGGLFGLWLFLIVARFAHDPEAKEILRKSESNKSLAWSGLVNLGIGCCPIIDNAAHAGGALAGLVLGLLLRNRGAPSIAMKGASALLVVAAGVSLAVAGAMGGTAAEIFRSFERLEKTVQAKDPAACAIQLDALTYYGGPSLARVVGRSTRVASTLVTAAEITTRAPVAVAAAQALDAHGVRAAHGLLVRARLLEGDEHEVLAAVEAAKLGATPAELGEVGQQLSLRGRTDLALPLLEAWVTGAPRSAEALNALAWALLTAREEKLREPKRALALARQGVALREPFGMRGAMILDTLAEAELQNGLPDSALEHEQRAIDVGSKTILDEAWWKSVQSEYRERLARCQAAVAARREGEKPR